MSTDRAQTTDGTMMALRWRGRGDVALEHIPVPVPAPDEALIAVEWVGLCGSDLEEYRDGPVVIPGPIVLGHEIVGRVSRAAADGSGPLVGTRVVVDVVTGCGECFWCLDHNEGLCPHEVVTGMDVNGGLAEYVTGRASRLVPIPDTLDMRRAALAEPTAVAVRALHKIGDVHGRGVLIVGGGTIGLLTAQVLRHAGAESVVIVEPHEGRRRVAADMGMSSLWSESASERSAAVGELFPDRGPDVVVECSGADGAAAEAISAARAGGLVVLLSVTTREQAIDTTAVMLAEKTIVGSAAHMWDADVVPAVELLATGAVQADPLISHTVPLHEGARAFEILADPAERALKILIAVGAASESI